MEVGDTSGAEIYLQYHSIIIPFTKVIFSWFQQGWSNSKVLIEIN